MNEIPDATATRMNGAEGLRAKVAHLSLPGSYPDNPASVEVVQTHMSCVFLTDQHAWKLKKPVRYEFLDFSTPQARRFNCEEEMRLNRRLSPDVYLGVVPLVALPEGGFRLDGDGEPVDWLVKMRRLPRRLMLDQAIREGSVREQDVRRFALVLAKFFRSAVPVSMDPATYRARYASGIPLSLHEMARSEYCLPPNLVRSAERALLAALERAAAHLEQRARETRIIEGHGDLRPEHVCLGPDPLIIDCLEFNRDLRLLDPAEELAYLAMECTYAGAPEIGATLFAAYREYTGDTPSAALIAFYRAYRASLRAKLCVWHLKDHSDPAEQGKWIARAQRYLELSEKCAVVNDRTCGTNRTHSDQR